MNPIRTGAPVWFVLLAAGCSSIRFSELRTGRSVAASNAPVEISATRDPPGAEELGVVEVSGTIPDVKLGALVSAFRARVASMGGNYGRIDSFATKHHMVTESHDYECGGNETEFVTQSTTETAPDGSTTTGTETVPVTKYVSKTCTEERRVEVATLTVVGRALRTTGRNP